jgi:hypothetical protein
MLAISIILNTCTVVKVSVYRGFFGESGREWADGAEAAWDWGLSQGGSNGSQQVALMVGECFVPRLSRGWTPLVGAAG